VAKNGDGWLSREMDGYKQRCGQHTLAHPKNIQKENIIIRVLRNSIYSMVRSRLGKNLRGRNIRERILCHDSIHFPLPAHKDIVKK
jgi:hypothetical protein